MAEADFVGNDLSIAEQALAAYDLPPASTLTTSDRQTRAPPGQFAVGGTGPYPTRSRG